MQVDEVVHHFRISHHDQSERTNTNKPSMRNFEKNKTLCGGRKKNFKWDLKNVQKFSFFKMYFSNLLSTSTRF